MLSLDHVVLEVRDPERAAAFYAEVLDLEPVRLDEYRAGKVKFVSLRVSAETVIDLFPPAMWRAQTAAANPNHFALAGTAELVAQVRERLAARGLPVTKVDDHNFGARGYGRSIYFDDPDGNSVEVRSY